MIASRIGLAAIAAFTLLAFASHHAMAAGVTAEYDVRYGILTILSLRATSEVDPERYQGTTEMKTVGVAAALFPWRVSATTEGWRDDAGLHPLRHRSTGQYRSQVRTVAIDYESSGQLTTVISPRPEDDDRDAVPAMLQQHAIDPLTATLGVIDRDCRGIMPVFDGRRRYDLSLSDRGETDIPMSRGLPYHGHARLCHGEITPLAGFWRSDAHREEPTRIDCWIASPQPGLPPIPIYLEVASGRGTFTIQLTAFAPA